MFRGSVKGTGYPLHSPVSPSLPLPCVSVYHHISTGLYQGRLRLKCDGIRAETRFRLSAKRTRPFKSAGGTSVQSIAGSQGVRISGSNAGYTMFRGSVKSTCNPLHSPVSPSLPLPCVTVCHHISTGLYQGSNCWAGRSCCDLLRFSVFGFGFQLDSVAFSFNVFGYGFPQDSVAFS